MPEYHERQRKSPPAYKNELPDVHTEDPHLQDVLEKIISHIRVREGDDPNKGTSFVTMDDLERMGVIKSVNGVVKGGGVSGEFTSADGKKITVRDGIVAVISEE